MLVLGLKFEAVPSHFFFCNSLHEFNPLAVKYVHVDRVYRDRKAQLVLHHHSYSYQASQANEITSRGSA